MQSHHAREHVREEPLGVPEKGPFALQAAELLEEGHSVSTSESESRLSEP